MSKKKRMLSKGTTTSARPKADQSVAESGNKHAITKSDANRDHSQTVKNRKKERFENEQVDSGSSEQQIKKDELLPQARKAPPHKTNSSSHLDHPQLKSTNNLAKILKTTTGFRSV